MKKQFNRITCHYLFDSGFFMCIERGIKMVHNLIANVKDEGVFYLKVVPHDLEKSNSNKQEAGQMTAKESKIL